ncbi:MAG TPA: class I SAM-dependent DNA methyltransferase [Anaerolineae bacterium]|nr:class I SAM-dependent DNA methyltransferase [Anaerolineae bacterium]
MSNNNHTPLGFETKLWAAADQMRGHMDPAEYKHVVLGLIFLKYISDTFQNIYDELEADEWADPEDQDEYLSRRAFWVPKAARWGAIQAQAKQANIGTVIDDAMLAIEANNPSLKGVLPTNYGRPDLNKQRLGQVVDLIGSIGLGGQDDEGHDILGRVFEYFLGEFAAAEGKRGGQFYTPQPVVKLLVAMLEPTTGRVYDPCCGSGGMFVQSAEFVRAHGGNQRAVSIYGQESNPTTWKLCKMNLAIRGISHDIGGQNADSFLNDLHKDLKADYILANPPFNMKAWGAEQLESDVRWQYGLPPKRNANYGWIQHMVHHLSPGGRAGFVLANGSMSTQTGGEGDIREALVKADLVECMVALPGQLFYTTQIPVCLWFLSRQKPSHRRGQILFIDARQMGEMVDRTLRTLTDDDINKIATIYRAWRQPAPQAETILREKGPVYYTSDQEPADEETDWGAFDYAIPGFTASTELKEVAEHNYVLTPGRYVGIPEEEDDGEPFEEKMERLVEELREQMAEGRRLEAEIEKNLEGLGYASEKSN